VRKIPQGITTSHVTVSHVATGGGALSHFSCEWFDKIAAIQSIVQETMTEHAKA
jgi:hypothetical protein